MTDQEIEQAFEKALDTFGKDEVDHSTARYFFMQGAATGSRAAFDQAKEIMKA